MYHNSRLWASERQAASMHVLVGAIIKDDVDGVGVEARGARTTKRLQVKPPGNHDIAGGAGG